MKNNFSDDEIATSRSEIGKRLKATLLLKRMTSKELAEALGITEGGVNHWLRGVRSPEGPVLVKLSKLLKISVDWLLTGEESTFEPPVTKFEELKGENHKVHAAHFIPVVSKVTAGDRGAILEESNIMYHFPVVEKPGPTAMLVEVEGDSMIREKGRSINPGDLVWVDLNEVVVFDGDIVVVTTTDGRQMVKQYLNKDATRIELRSYNPDYPPIYVDKEDIVRIFRVLKVIPKGWKP